MKRGVIIAMCCCLLVIFKQRCVVQVSDLKVEGLTCDFRTNPIGIGNLKPRLSWKLSSQNPNQKQKAYQIIVASSEDLILADSGDLWNTGIIWSNQSLNISYCGEKLSPNQTCFWKVKVWDGEEIETHWSDVNFWTVGLVNQDNWQSSWIGLKQERYDSLISVKPWGNNMVLRKAYKTYPSVYLGHKFSTPKKVEKAIIYCTSLGVYTALINGKRVGSDFFTPGWTDYKKRVYYNTYDVTKMLHEGENAVAVMLANGWYAGTVANRGQNYYGNQPWFRAEIHLTYEDGSKKIITTDGEWKASVGAITEADMQGGETFDARLNNPSWGKANFNDSEWNFADIYDTLVSQINAYPSIGVQRIAELDPKEILKRENGTYLVDFAQNFAGWVGLTLKGESGDSVVIRYAEKLNSDGSLYTRNLRSARAMDTYVLSGDSSQYWEPKFTYHGFRFVEICGYRGELTKGDLKGIVVHTNLTETGRFECSNPLINQIYHNIYWSQKSNYIDVPTDCPQRDERMGWTGDAQVFMPTAAFNMNIAPFFNKWLVDIYDGQFENGRFPSTAPRVYNRVAAGWGDAGIICPWHFYQFYADTTILAKFYPSMQRWITHLENRSPTYISTLGSYGDWQNVESETPIPLLATAYFKRSVDLMSQISGVLSKRNDSIEYAGLSEKIKKAFTDSFLLDSGRIESETQTAYLLALAFDLVPRTERQQVVDNLKKSIYNADTSLTTGIIGTSLLLPTLTDIGETDLAYKLVLNTDFPSWGYQVKHGATTIWERWDGFTEDGFHEDSTNSLNHYAYGSVGEWFYSTIGGINALEPGFKKILIRPLPGGDLQYANVDYESSYGPISSHWKIENGFFYHTVSIPANTSAVIQLPNRQSDKIRIEDQPISESSLVKDVVAHDSHTTFEISSGEYHFSMPFDSN